MFVARKVSFQRYRDCCKVLAVESSLKKRSWSRKAITWFWYIGVAVSQFPHCAALFAGIFETTEGRKQYAPIEVKRAIAQ